MIFFCLKKLKNRFVKHRLKKRAGQFLCTLSTRYERALKSGSQRDSSIEAVLDKLLGCSHGSKALKGSSCACREAKSIFKSKLKATWKDHLREAGVTCLLILFILIFVRQMVFEHQVIPTGSMRPTFLELDHVIVSKTAFGINKPLGLGQIVFDRSLLKRGQILTLSSEGLPRISTDVLHYKLIPGKKRFVKRLIAEPGDKVWFYGGKVYILGKGEKQLIDSSSYIKGQSEYIPFHFFFGHLETQFNSLTSYHFQKPIFNLEKGSWNRWKINNDTKPVSDDMQKSPLPWGMQHIGMARLLTHKELYYSPLSSSNLPEADYYLEIAHNPTLFPHALTHRDSMSPFYVHRSLLALQNEHVKRLQNSLYTSRFVVKNYKANAYSSEGVVTSDSIELQGVPDGAYEFFDGVCYKINKSGERTLLSQKHPLYDIKHLPTLFNCGISWASQLLAKPTSSPYLPYRYVYFDHGDLKTMKNLLMEKNEGSLIHFVEHEKELALRHSFYSPFIDPMPPSLELVAQKGLEVGPDEVMLLGDNHSASGDSRDFGLVALKNIEGSPLMIISPFSSIKRGINGPSRSLNIFDSITVIIFLAWWLAARAHCKHKHSKARRFVLSLKS